MWENFTQVPNAGYMDHSPTSKPLNYCAGIVILIYFENNGVFKFKINCNKVFVIQVETAFLIYLKRQNNHQTNQF